MTPEVLKEKTGLITNHGYQIIDSREVQKVRLLKLRNPWGKEEWTGPYSDESKEMTEKLKKQLNHVNADDGSFWMSINDFMKYFNDIDYAFPKEKGWKETNLYGIFEGYLSGRTFEYEKPNAGCLPQWSIKFSQKTTVRISYDIGGPKQIMTLFIAQAHGRKIDQITDDSVKVKYVAGNSYFNGIEYNVEDISEPYTILISRNENNDEPLYYRILVESPDQNYVIEKFDDNFMKLNSVSAQSMFPTPDKEFWDPFKNYPLTTCKQWYLRLENVKFEFNSSKI